ncbi:MAG: phage major capsid protein, partial [Pseudomonadota bacterium]
VEDMGIVRPSYAPGPEEDAGPVLKMSGPYDSLSAQDLAWGYMVMKAHRVPISQTYWRAVHGQAVKHVQAEGLKPMIRPAADSPIGRLYGAKAAPIIYHNASDTMIYKALSTQADELMAVKANELMGSDVNAAGDQWVPVFYSRELFRYVRNEASVAPLFRQLEIQGESYTFPVQSGGVTWYKTPQTDSASQLVYSDTFVTTRISQAATGNITLTPSKLSAIVIWSGELNEQTLVPMLPFLQQEFVESGAHTLDELLISGDESTGATNISDYANGAISAYWRLLVLDGLRHHAFEEGSGANTRDGGGITAEDFLGVKKLMGTNGRYAVQPSKVAWIFDLLTYYKAQALGELLTRDKHIPATIEDGEITKIFGTPVTYSEDYGATDANGDIHNTAENNTKGSFLCVRPDQGVIGFGRRMEMETSRIPRADAYEIVGHMSVDFDLTSYEFVACAFNLTV